MSEKEQKIDKINIEKKNLIPAQLIFKNKMSDLANQI